MSHTTMKSHVSRDIFRLDRTHLEVSGQTKQGALKPRFVSLSTRAAHDADLTCGHASWAEKFEYSRDS